MHFSVGESVWCPLSSLQEYSPKVLYFDYKKVCTPLVHVMSFNTKSLLISFLDTDNHKEMSLDLNDFASLCAASCF